MGQRELRGQCYLGRVWPRDFKHDDFLLHSRDDNHLELNQLVQLNHHFNLKHLDEPLNHFHRKFDHLGKQLIVVDRFHHEYEIEHDQEQFDNQFDILGELYEQLHIVFNDDNQFDFVFDKLGDTNHNQYHHDFKQPFDNGFVDDFLPRVGRSGRRSTGDNWILSPQQALKAEAIGIARAPPADLHGRSFDEGMGD